MTPPATEPACGWVIRCTWKIEDPNTFHPRHSFQAMSTRQSAETTAWNVSLGSRKGLTLAEVHLRQGPDGPWEELPLPKTTSIASAKGKP